MYFAANENMEYYFNKDPLALAKNIEIYLNLKPPDCSLFSKDFEEIPVHKEILYQTNSCRKLWTVWIVVVAVQR